MIQGVDPHFVFLPPFLTDSAYSQEYSVFCDSLQSYNLSTNFRYIKRIHIPKYRNQLLQMSKAVSDNIGRRY